jgi:hypothetical protein
MLVAGASLLTAGAAAAASAHASTADAAVASANVATADETVSGGVVLVFNDAAKQAQLTIPKDSCTPGVKCKWMLFMNLPFMPHQPRVGYVVGKSGTLVLAYPTFCGVIQADALRGPAPWKFRTGIREKIENCTNVGTTTTTSAVATSTTASTQPEHTVAAVSTTTPTTAAAATSALPFSGTSSSAVPAATTATTAAAQLPFTGFDVRPLLLIGTALVLLGGLLLSTVESRRRMLRRATAVTLADVKDGARRTSTWFLGQ